MPKSPACAKQRTAATTGAIFHVEMIAAGLKKSNWRILKFLLSAVELLVCNLPGGDEWAYGADNKGLSTR